MTDKSRAGAATKSMKKPTKATMSIVSGREFDAVADAIRARFHPGETADDLGFFYDFLSSSDATDSRAFTLGRGATVGLFAFASDTALPTPKQLAGLVNAAGFAEYAEEYGGEDYLVETSKGVNCVASAMLLGGGVLHLLWALPSQVVLLKATWDSHVDEPFNYEDELLPALLDAAGLQAHAWTPQR
jgi:hypothetical protein